MLCMQASDHVDGTKGLIYKLAHACHIRQWKNKCGMRRPSLGQNEDDLSRLTTILSPTSISLSSNGQSDPVVVVVANDHHDVVSCSRAKTNSSSSSSSSSSNSSTSSTSSSNGVSNTTSNNSVGGDGGVDGSSTSSKVSNSSSSSDGLKPSGGNNRASYDDVRGGGGGDGGDDETRRSLPPPPPPVLVNQYLPNLINSSEWQNCRKRKERQDSTSSISQDRKLIRSNSEEHLPNCQEVIRRVSSHEDFKKRTAGVVSVEISIDKENIIAEEPIEGDGDEREQQQVFEKNLKNSADDLKKFFIGSVESIANGGSGKDHHHHPHHHHHHHGGNHLYHHLGGHHHPHHLHHSGGKAQQSHHRLSPCRDILKSRRDSDSEQDGEHERRRHCERFSKTRPPPGRKSVSPRARSGSKHSKLAVKASSVGGTVLLTGSEHFYSKHDTHPAKSERRRSASKHRELQQQQQQQTALQDDAPMGEGAMPLSDYNDNNVLEKNQAVEEASALIDDEVEEMSEVQRDPATEPESEPLSPREKLPWGQSYPDDTPALVCQRFSDDKFDHAKRMDSVSHAKLRPVSSGGSLKLYGAYHRSAENAAPPSTIHHHQHHHKSGASPAANNMFDERVKAINRKLGLLKKKLTQFEDRFERDHGCRPTHGDKTADPAVKSIVVEMHKLRKEKNQIKTDSAGFAAKASVNSGAPGQKQTSAGGQEDETAEEKRLVKMKDTIVEIEKRLTEKRDTDQRSENLELLSNEQLTEEKASVQRALLYLESMYGRPASREERDAARPLYDRYRLIKRLVNRANSISGPCGVANSQMPTILEHEALAIVGTTTPSTDISPPSATSMIQSPTDTTTTSSTSTTSGQQSADEQSEGATTTTTTTTTSSSATENIHSMTADELWQHYDATREEKKELRRTIKDFEQQFEETTGRKMLKSDRKSIEDTYALYKQKKAKLRLIDALFKKQMHA